jgi:tetratricopeptide (TPR) repeat protein
MWKKIVTVVLLGSSFCFGQTTDGNVIPSTEKRGCIVKDILLNEALLKDTLSLDELFQRSVDLRRIGEYEDSFIYICKAFYKDSLSCKVICELGTLYALMNELDLAKLCFEKSISIDPFYYTAYNARGAFRYWFVDDVKGALEDFNKALLINSKSFRAHYNRALVYSDLDEYEKAIEDLDVAVKLSRFDNQTFLLRGECYKSIKEYRKAIRDFSKALKYNNKIDPWEKIDSGYILNLRSRCYQKINKFKKAQKDKERARALGYLD